MRDLIPGGSTKVREAIQFIEDHLNDLLRLNRLGLNEQSQAHELRTDPATDSIYQRNAAGDDWDYIGVANRAYLGAPVPPLLINGLNLRLDTPFSGNGTLRVDAGEVLLGGDGPIARACQGRIVIPSTISKRVCVQNTVANSTANVALWAPGENQPAMMDPIGFTDMTFNILAGTIGSRAYGVYVLYNILTGAVDIGISAYPGSTTFRSLTANLAYDNSLNFANDTNWKAVCRIGYIVVDVTTSGVRLAACTYYGNHALLRLGFDQFHTLGPGNNTLTNHQCPPGVMMKARLSLPRPTTGGQIGVIFSPDFSGFNPAGGFYYRDTREVDADLQNRVVYDIPIGYTGDLHVLLTTYVGSVQNNQMGKCVIGWHDFTVPRIWARPPVPLPAPTPIDDYSWMYNI